MLLTVILIIGLFTASGCKKYLDVVNPNSQTLTEFWKTPADADAAMTSLYAAICMREWGQQWDFNEHYRVMNEVRTDMAEDQSWDVVMRLSEFNYNPTEYMEVNNWHWCYRMVFTANQILENVDNVEGLDDSQKAIYKGEAKFARAHAYFQLLKNFGNIELINKLPEKSADFYNNQVPASEVWAQIESDLTDAKAVLPDSWEAKWLGRVTKGAATTYLGKVYLFQGKWAAAEQEFKEVTTMGYQLESDYWSLFTGQNEFNKESIWEINFTSDETGGRCESTSIPSHIAAWQTVWLTDWGKQLFLTDTADNGTFSQRFYGSVLYDDPGCDVYYWHGQSYRQFFTSQDLPNENRMFFKKFVVPYNNWSDPTKGDVNFYIFRYSDVLLMLAEALNEQGKTAEAIPYVNQVRQRAGSHLIGALSQEELRQHIRHVERPLEFVCEATRVEDLVRWYGFGKEGGLKALYTSHNRFSADNFRDGISELFPIPQEEIDANPNIKQNPGY